MSMLVNADGSTRTYVVVDNLTKTILDACNYVQEAAKRLDGLKKSNPGDLALHNITHPKCPDWIKELVRSDSVYCSRRAQDYDARAAALRSKAATLQSEADDWEAGAAKWRELSQAASAPSGPGM